MTHVFKAGYLATKLLSWKGRLSFTDLSLSTQEKKLHSDRPFRIFKQTRKMLGLKKNKKNKVAERENELFLLRVPS